MKVPMTAERATVQRISLKSAQLGNLMATDLTRSTATSSFCDWFSNSPMANRPISTGTKWMPSTNSETPKTKRSTPVVR